MKRQKSRCRWQTIDRAWLIHCSFIVALITLTACDSPLLVPEALRPRQPASPLIPGGNTVLTQTLWQITEITSQGEPVAIDAIQPIYVTFTANGYLNVRAPSCFGDSYVIGAASTSHYRLHAAGATAAMCGEPQDTQRVAMSKALLKTKEYAIEEDELILRGEEVEFVLTNQGPLIPGANTALVENRWRLVEATYQGEAVEFEAIQPIYLTFTVDGQLIKSTTNCNSDGYYIIANSEQHYRLVPRTGTAKGCGESGDRQYAHITEAIAATTEYAMQDDQLLLIGDDVRIVLEISNDQ